MLKGLLICYAIVISTFFSVANAIYWAFGNASTCNIFTNLAPSGGVALIPNWLLFLDNMFVIAELFVVALVSIQPSPLSVELFKPFNPKFFAADIT
jgi:hypothetical protein